MTIRFGRYEFNPLRATAEILKPLLKLRVIDDIPLPASLFFISSFFLGALLSLYTSMFFTLFSVAFSIALTFVIAGNKVKEFHKEYNFMVNSLFVSFFICLGYKTAPDYELIARIFYGDESASIYAYGLVLIIYSCYIASMLIKVAPRMDRVWALMPLWLVWLTASNNSGQVAELYVMALDLACILLVLGLTYSWNKDGERN